MVQQHHSWAYFQRKSWLENMHANIHCSAVYNSNVRKVI